MGSIYWPAIRLRCTVPHLPAVADPTSHSPPGAPRPVDARALARVRARLARAAQPPWLHAEAARRMAERLPLIRRTPATVLEWGPRLGGGSTELRAAYPQARCLRGEWEEVLDQQGAEPAPRRGWRGWFGPRQEPALWPAEVPAEGAQLLWASMVLHGAADPLALLRDWSRALAVDGFLMCCTLGPGSLPQLRELYGQAGWGSPAAGLVDMHDLGDMMVAAGLADPVMDQELLTLTWPDPQAALDELRSLGGNVDPLRHPGLRTPRWQARLREALAARARQRADGRVALTFELVYGHAFKAEPALKVAAHTSFSPTQLQRMARGTRRGGA
jgi:malonyl-CoA O-methyltransferase